MNNFEPKDNNELYCATCGKLIKCGEMLAWSSTKSGTLKVHHAKKCGVKNE